MSSSTALVAISKKGAELALTLSGLAGKQTVFLERYPTIPWARGREEVEALGLRKQVEPLFFVENAKRAYRWDADTD